MADALRARLAEPDGPEIVIVLSERSPNGFDQLTMDSARRGLIKGLRRADRHGRLRIVAPHTPKGQPILIHSKVAIIDRRFLRIGSTKLNNNRSFGYDTECDLSIELRPDDAAGRAALDRGASRSLGHHGGCPSDAFAQAYAERGTLRAVLDDPALMPSPRLCPLVPSHRGPIARLVEAFHLGDPGPAPTTHGVPGGGVGCCAGRARGDPSGSAACGRGGRGVGSGRPAPSSSAPKGAFFTAPERSRGDPKKSSPFLFVRR